MRKVYKAPWSWACVPTAERRMKKNPGHPAENPLPPGKLPHSLWPVADHDIPSGAFRGKCV